MYRTRFGTIFLPRNGGPNRSLAYLKRRFFEYDPKRNVETGANALQRIHLQVFLTAFDSAVVGPVHLNLISKRLLAHAERGSSRSEHASQFFRCL